jgi:plastocyanin
MLKRWLTLTSFAVVAALAACGGEAKEESDATEQAVPAAAPAPAPGGEVAPGPGGKVIEISMNTDDKGNYFEPKEVEARPGDVLRFVLKSGVHNVHFVADSNPGKQGLPPASEMLQLPGQTYDFAVPAAEGDYYFQCDPHALLGMVGKLEVERDDD